MLLPHLYVIGLLLLTSYGFTIALQNRGAVQFLPGIIFTCAYGFVFSQPAAAILSYGALLALVVITTNIKRFQWTLRIVTVIFGLAVALRVTPTFPSFGPTITHELSALSGSWSIYGSINKAVVGLIMLPLVDWAGLQLRSFTKHLPLLTFGPVFIAIIAYASGLPFDFKLSLFTLTFAFANLSYVVICEEIFFRGLIQRYLHQAIKGAYSTHISIAIASIIFGVAHIGGGLHYVFLATLAGGIYGLAFWKGKSIWHSIFTHLAVNTLHIVFLQYPVPA